MDTSNIRNIGIFAHVDAGKTTLTEKLLALSGAVRVSGRVDAGTAHTDRLDIEKRRGISVKTACAPIMWRGARIRVIDTPGHADFSSEIERGAWALDGAILVVSGVDGVQPQTETLFEYLRRAEVPALIFVNKCDRPTADFERALDDIKRALTPLAYDHGDASARMACLAEYDERALEDYIDGVVYAEERALKDLSGHVRALRAYPVLRGSALTGEGVNELLDAVKWLLPPPPGDADAPLSGVVFAVEPDANMGRCAYVRLYSGRLKNRESVRVSIRREDAYGAFERSEARKLTQIRAISPDGHGADLGGIECGDIAVVYGLGDVRAGQVLGDKALLPKRVRSGDMRAPLVTVRAAPGAPDELPKLMRALKQLAAEDPLMTVRPVPGAVNVSLMGDIQLEVLAETLGARYQLNASLGEPEIVYRETIKQTTVGFVAYTMPKPCWAVLKFEIEPAPRGEGVSYECLITEEQIRDRYRTQIAQAIPMSLRQGILGWQVDDVRIRLIDGEDHPVHTHPLDFTVATPMAIMDGLRRAGSVLLEPVLEFRARVPEGDCAGKLISEMNVRRGRVRAAESGDSRMTLICECPAATSLDLPKWLARVSGGRASLTSRLTGYRECPIEAGKTRERVGVNPLDTAKYILAARSALEGGIFDEA